MAARHAEPRLAEFAFIRTLRRRVASRDKALIRGIGDDAAVVASARAWWHITTDLLAEGVHFDLKTATPESVGYRAGMANLSDLAAMGAVPRYMLVAVAIPPAVGSRDVTRLFAGIRRTCRLHGVTLIGGDTSASRAGLVVTIVMLGTTAPGRALFRRGARVGDALYVTGTIGDSLAGLQLLKPDARAGTLPARHRRFLIDRHLRPHARVSVGRWLNDTRLATAAIDLSDGLSGDLRHICEESGVGAEVQEGALPLSPAARGYAAACGTPPERLALTGGEDYELLFTVSPANVPRLEREARRRRFPLTRIGSMLPRRLGMRLVTLDGGVRAMPVTSYEHFRSEP